MKTLTYTIAVDAYPLEYSDIVVEAVSPADAYAQAWEKLRSEQKDATASLEIVEVA